MKWSIPKKRLKLCQVKVFFFYVITFKLPSWKLLSFGVVRVSPSSTFFEASIVLTMLACSLHCQVNTPLIRFQNIFIWLGFSRFFAMLSFFPFFFPLQDRGLLEGACAPPRSIACSLCMCSLKSPEFWKVQVQTTWHGHWSSVCPARTFRLKWKKKQTKKKSKGKLSHWLLDKN